MQETATSNTNCNVNAIPMRKVKKQNPLKNVNLSLANTRDLFYY